MRTYKVELTTPASVAQVGAFYKATMQQHGLTIVSETESGARGYSFEARSADRMHQVYLNVNRSANHTRVTLMDHYTLPRP